MTLSARILQNLYLIRNFHIPGGGNVFKKSKGRYGFYALFFVGVLSISPVHADWLDDVWSDKQTSRHGHPAITISAESGITITLPEVSVGQAKAAGLSRQQAALAFLGRYGPEMCSQIVDLNENKPALAVKLIVQNARGLSEASLKTQQSVSEAIAEAQAQGQRLSPGEDTIFEASPHEDAWTIDYAPTHRAQCVLPPEKQVVRTHDPVGSSDIPENGI